MSALPPIADIKPEEFDKNLERRGAYAWTLITAARAAE